MRRLIVLGAVVLLLLVGDRAAAAYAESKADAAITDRLVGIAGVRVDIRSFPFVGRLLVSGGVSRLDVRLSEVAGHGIDVADMRFDARGVELDRGRLFDGKVRVTDVDVVHVSARITEAAIRRVSGVDLRLVEGKGTATLAGGVIRLSVGGLPAVQIPAPDASLLPCEAELRVEDDALVASCTSDELPEFIASAVVDV